MKNTLARLFLLPFSLILSACAGPDVSHYAKVEPKLDLMQYFVGKTEAWGMFQKRSGEVVKRFNVSITGTQEHDKLTLDERFTYDDGTSQQRIWTLLRQTDGSWRGTAGDVLGEAVGRVSGNAFNLRYTLLLPVDGSTYEMQMDDWMFLLDQHTIVNRTSMSKFGFEVGQVTLFFRKN